PSPAARCVGLPDPGRVCRGLSQGLLRYAPQHLRQAAGGRILTPHNLIRPGTENGGRSVTLPQDGKDRQTPAQLQGQKVPIALQGTNKVWKEDVRDVQSIADELVHVIQIQRWEQGSFIGNMGIDYVAQYLGRVEELGDDAAYRAVSYEKEAYFFDSVLFELLRKDN